MMINTINAIGNTSALRGYEQAAKKPRAPEKTEEAARGNRDRLELSLAAESEAAAEEDALEEASENAETEEAAEADETEEGSVESEELGGKVAVNAEKRARQIASASSPDEVNIVLQLLSGDLADCRAGLDKGRCDEDEIKKVEALIAAANKRLAEVAGNEDDGKLDDFELNLLL